MVPGTAKPEGKWPRRAPTSESCSSQSTRPPIWTCRPCGTEHHDPKITLCRKEGCHGEKPGGNNRGNNTNVKGKGKDKEMDQGADQQQAQPPTAAPTFSPPTRTGITPSDKEFILRVERRGTLDADGGHPTVQEANHPREDQSEIRRLQAQIKAHHTLEEDVQDEKWLTTCQNKLDKLLDVQHSLSGEQRVVSRLHGILSNVQKASAANTEDLEKEKKQADEALALALGRVQKVEEAMEAQVRNDKLRQDRGCHRPVQCHLSACARWIRDSIASLHPKGSTHLPTTGDRSSPVIHDVGVGGPSQSTAQRGDTPEMNGANAFAKALLDVVADPKQLQEKVDVEMEKANPNKRTRTEARMGTRTLQTRTW